MGFAEGFREGWTMMETMRANQQKRKMDEEDLALRKAREERDARVAEESIASSKHAREVIDKKLPYEMYDLYYRGAGAKLGYEIDAATADDRKKEPGLRNRATAAQIAAADQQYRFAAQLQPLQVDNLRRTGALTDQQLLNAGDAGRLTRLQLSEAERKQQEALLEQPDNAYKRALDTQAAELKLFNDQYTAVKTQFTDATTELRKAQYAIDNAAALGTDPAPADIARRDSLTGYVAKLQEQLTSMGDPAKKEMVFRVVKALTTPAVQSALLNAPEVKQFIASNTPPDQVFAPISVYQVGGNFVINGVYRDAKTGAVVAKGPLSDQSGAPVVVPADQIAPLLDQYVGGGQRQTPDQAQDQPVQMPKLQDIPKAIAARAEQYVPTILTEAEKAYNNPKFGKIKNALSLDDFKRLVVAVAEVESGFNPAAVNNGPNTSATGMFQIQPATAAKPGFGVDPLPWDQIFNPQANIRFGVNYMAGLLNYYGGVDGALKGYNSESTYNGKVKGALNSVAARVVPRGDGLPTKATQVVEQAQAPAAALPAGTPPGLGAATTAVVAPSAGQPAVSAAGQPATPAQIPVQALAAPEASWQGLRDADAFQIVQEKHGVPNPPPVVTQLADAPSTLGVAWGAVKDAYTGFADYRKEQNARVDASAASTHFINTYLERPLIPAPSLSEYRRKPQEGEAKEYFAARGAMLEHRLLTPEQVAHLDQFFAPYAAEGFIPASRPPGEQRPSGALADVPLLEDAPDPPAPPSGNPPASAGLAGGALFTQRVADLSQRYGFANPKQAAIAASLPDGIDDTKREMAREFRKEYAKLTAVDESYDASSGVLVTKHGGVVTGIRTLGVAGNSAKAEKEKFELIKDLVKTYIPTIKDKKGRVLNPEEEAEFISQATTLTNQMPGVEITAANMPKLIFMFKLQKSLSMAEEGKVKFTSLAPAYNLVKAGGKYLDEEVAQTTLLKAAGMEAQSQASGGNLDAGQAVKIITAPDHPITGHLIKHNMDPALAVHITDRIEARIAEWRTRNPDDPTSTPVLARRILNEFIAKTKEDRAGSAGDKAVRVRKEAYGNGEAK